MQINEQREPGAVVLALAGRLDSNTCGDLEKTLLGVIDGGEAAVVVDFAELAYVSSAGLRVLLMAAKRLRAGNGKLALCGLSDNIREVFSMSGFDKILPIRPTRREALAAVA
jgi:anti-sigma B factor antagonist